MAERDFRLTDRYLELKGALHLHLIRLLEDRGIDIESWSDAKAAEFIRGQVRGYVNERRIPINQTETHILAEAGSSSTRSGSLCRSVESSRKQRCSSKLLRRPTPPTVVDASIIARSQHNNT